MQWRIVATLSQVFARDGEVRAEVPYRPSIDEQFWIADVAFLPRALLERLDRAEEWFPYASALIVEVLSPSNRRAKIERQRDIAFDAGRLAKGRTFHLAAIVHKCRSITSSRAELALCKQTEPQR